MWNAQHDRFNRPLKDYFYKNLIIHKFLIVYLWNNVCMQIMQKTAFPSMMSKDKERAQLLYVAWGYITWLCSWMIIELKRQRCLPTWWIYLIIMFVKIHQILLGSSWEWYCCCILKTKVILLYLIPRQNHMTVNTIVARNPRAIQRVNFYSSQGT